MTGLEVEFDDRGHKTDVFADKCVNRLVNITDSAAPHVRQQAVAQKKTIRDLIHFWMDRAVNSDRYRIEKELRSMGHPEAADFVKQGIVR